MADLKVHDQKEEKFLRENQWYSFTSAVYGAVGGAAFFGILMTISQALVAGAAGVGEGAAFASALMAPAPLAVIGGLMLLGTVSVYMAQRENTIGQSIRDEHLAEQQAKCMAHGKAHTHAIEHEHGQNCRGDGKQWGDVVATQNAVGQAAAR